MFCVMFESQPEVGAADADVGNAGMLRAEYEGIGGFVDHRRYHSLRREGWTLSLSTWANEKALVRWRMRPRHHRVQEMSRDGMLADYRCRVGRVADDTAAADGSRVVDARFRRIRVIRDYGLFDRREAPQYFADVPGRETLHA